MTADPFDPSRVAETAQRMLDRYSTPRAAEDMAWDHACAHTMGSRRAVYWRQVCEQIRALRDQRRQARP